MAASAGGRRRRLRAVRLLHARPPLDRSGRAAVIVVERLRDGPVPDAARSRHRHRPHLVARRAPEPVRAGAHTICSPASTSSGGASSVQSVFAGRVGELAQRPAGARLGLHRSGRSPRTGASTSFAAFVGDTRRARAARDGERRPAVRSDQRLRRRRTTRRSAGAACCRAPASTGRCSTSGSSARSAATAATATGCRSNDLAYGDPTRRPPTSTAGTPTDRRRAAARARSARSSSVSARAPAASPASRRSIRR